MKRIGVSFVALLLMSLFVSTAHGATNIWANTFPATGTDAGTIKIQGKLTVDDGWTADSQGAAAVWPVGSGPVTTKIISVNADGTWSTTITGLTSGQEYWVTVSILEKKGGMTKVITTDPGKATAK